MRIWSIGLAVAVLATAIAWTNSEAVNEPTVCFVVLVRNKEHCLPYFLGSLERLDYPKDKITLWIALDHSKDRSQEIVETWLERVGQQYRHVSFNVSTSYNDKHELSDVEWTTERMGRIISLKTDAFDYARTTSKSDYIFFVDADAILTNVDTLRYLISFNKPVIAPMLNSTGSFSNFWGAMSEKGFYKSSDVYYPILDRKMLGAFNVPMVFGAFLVDLRQEQTKHLSFKHKNYTGPNDPIDDVILFALSARNNSVDLFVTNIVFFGYFPKPRNGKDNTIADEILEWRSLVTSREALLRVDFLPEPFSYDVISTTKLGFDEIFLLNLQRRPERFERMKRVLSLFNIGFRYFPAVDGQQLNASYLDEMGVKMLDGYLDPYSKRPLKMGEVGCFLTHYSVWQETERRNYKRVLVLEDDAWLEPKFHSELADALEDADRLVAEWDLIYLGRKRLKSEEEPVKDSSRLVWPNYSYWTISYALTLSGAKKLLEPQPLSKMVAVDEYLPIMYDKNPHTEWLDGFPKRDLIALSVAPLLLYPEWYSKNPGYLSDTEDSSFLNKEKQSEQQKQDDDDDDGDDEFNKAELTVTINLDYLVFFLAVVVFLAFALRVCFRRRVKVPIQAIIGTPSLKLKMGPQA